MIRRDWPDIGFTGVFDDEHSPEYRHVVAYFRAFKVEAWDGVTDDPLFWKKGETCNMPGTADPNDAEEFLNCSIKWDGCSNWTFGTMHLCEREHAEHVGTLMTRFYDWAKELGLDRL